MISVKITTSSMIIFTLCTVLFLACVKSSAIEPINATSDGIAIKGYDPVAYFLEGKPVKGSEEFAHTWMGAQWKFSSAENRDLFKSDPEKYAPQYGGY